MKVSLAPRSRRFLSKSGYSTATRLCQAGTFEKSMVQYFRYVLCNTHRLYLHTDTDTDKLDKHGNKLRRNIERATQITCAVLFQLLVFVVANALEENGMEYIQYFLALDSC